MTHDIYDDIRTRQQLALLPDTYKPAPHQPEMLYIGCIDARLDPIADIGIPRGKALIFRNIGALVRPPAEVKQGSVDASHIQDGEIPDNVSIGAALEFFVNKIPAPSGKMKHIVISGHTDCGGIRACLHGVDDKDSPYLGRYLRALEKVRHKIKELFSGMSEHEQLHKLEEDSVKNSIHNLLSYKVVQDAIAEGRLQVHGWVINTANGRIKELDEEKDKFIEMAQWQNRAKSGGPGGSIAK